MSKNERDLEALLDYLKDRRAVDFTGSKRSTLARRIAKRVEHLKLGSVADYIDHLEVHPEEFADLLNVILISVTSFFRDAPAWDKLAREIIPAIVAAKKEDEPIRVWSAGCASGEEAFTLAVLWAEALGADGFRQRVKIYATDVDGGALARARQCLYGAKAVESVPPELLKRYFTRTGNEYALRPDLKRAVIFGRHDLIQDAPISRLDLIVCRNTLMYFTPEAQRRVLNHFHFALNDKGFLFLGKAEMLLTHLNLFHPVDLKSRIFSKAADVARDRPLVLTQTEGRQAGHGLANRIRVWDEALELMPMAQVSVDAEGNLILANAAARQMFGLSVKDLGRPFRDMELSYRPIELRSVIDRVSAERRVERLAGIERELPGGELQCLDLQAIPLRADGGGLLGVLIVFEDVTGVRRMQSELQRASQELETAYEELQSTNEELETANEELQATVEELQTTNEELQATNEEQETMNEELQATNEELQTVNDELRARTGDLNRSNTLLEGILGTLRAPVAVVDRALDVLIWNQEAEEMWGVRSNQVRGQSFMSLEIGLPVSELLDPLRACLAGTSGPRELVVDAVGPRGKAMRCRVSITPMLGGNHDVQGAVVLMGQEE